MMICHSPLRLDPSRKFMLHAAMWVVVAAPIALAQTSAPVKSNATVAATPATAPATSVSPATTAAGPVAATPAADPTLGITFDVVSIKPVKAPQNGF